jgi:transcription antitermination protein NusB
MSNTGREGPVPRAASGRRGAGLGAAGAAAGQGRVSRRQARRQALFLLYQWDLTGLPLESLFEGSPDEFASSLARAVADEAPTLDDRISAASAEWPADRLGTLERNVLRIGVYELEEGTVPAEVAINEAVVLAKRYATEDAARLVNGILGAIRRDAA